MTVGDILADLARYPRHLPVKLVMYEIYHGPESGAPLQRIEATKEDAMPASNIRFEGDHILIESA